MVFGLPLFPLITVRSGDRRAAFESVDLSAYKINIAGKLKYIANTNSPESLEVEIASGAWIEV